MGAVSWEIRRRLAEGEVLRGDDDPAWTLTDGTKHDSHSNDTQERNGNEHSIDSDDRCDSIFMMSVTQT